MKNVMNIQTIDPEKPILPISAAAEMLGIKPRMLRFYEERGIIAPMRSSGNRRLYSLKDLDILAYVHYLTVIKRVNVAGVLEIQRILRRMKIATRAAFMAEIHKEIELLPENTKQRYAGDDDLTTEEIRKMDPPDPLQTQMAHAQPPVDPESLGNDAS
jgi:MerR family transcriptional regulator/heat shock protein HspR